MLLDASRSQRGFAHCNRSHISSAPACPADVGDTLSKQLFAGHPYSRPNVGAMQQGAENRHTLVCNGIAYHAAPNAASAAASASAFVASAALSAASPLTS